MEPKYLGDGVYVKADHHGRAVLTTGSHDERDAGSVIVLEPEVCLALVDYVKRAGIIPS